MSQHRFCPSCDAVFGDESDEFKSGECGSCVECYICVEEFTGVTDFDSMFEHHVDKHGHDRQHPLEAGANTYGPTQLSEASDCLLGQTRGIR